MFEWAYTPVGILVISFINLGLGMQNAKSLVKNSRRRWKIVGVLYAAMQLSVMFLFYYILVENLK